MQSLEKPGLYRGNVGKMRTQFIFSAPERKALDEGGASFVDHFCYFCLFLLYFLACLVVTCWERTDLLALICDV